MILAKRFLRLAMLFLALSVSSFVVGFGVDAYQEARFAALGRTAVLKSATFDASTDFEAFLAELPHPPGWLAFNVVRSAGAAQPAPIQPFLASPALSMQPRHSLYGEALARQVNQSSMAPLLLNLGVTSWTGRSFGLTATEYLQYEFMTPGPLWAVMTMGLWMAFWLMLALWLYHDARLRLGQKALPWLALGLVGGPVGVVIWLLQRPAPPAPPTLCHSCTTPQVEDATYCVACGAHLKPTCPECGRGIEREWKHCPTCGGDLNEASA